MGQVAKTVETWPFKPDLDERDDTYLIGLDATLGIKLKSAPDLTQPIGNWMTVQKKRRTRKRSAPFLPSISPIL